MEYGDVIPSVKYDGDLCIISVNVSGESAPTPIFQSTIVDEALICEQLTLGTYVSCSKLDMPVDAEVLMEALDIVHVGMLADRVMTVTQELPGINTINILQLELELASYLTDNSSPTGWNQNRIAMLCRRIDIDIQEVGDIVGLNYGPAEVTLHGINNKLSISTTNAKHIITVDQYPDFLPKLGRLTNRVPTI